jgi:hypothetical protein
MISLLMMDTKILRAVPHAMPKSSYYVLGNCKNSSNKQRLSMSWKQTLDSVHIISSFHYDTDPHEKADSLSRLNSIYIDVGSNSNSTIHSHFFLSGVYTLTCIFVYEPVMMHVRMPDSAIT